MLDKYKYREANKEDSQSIVNLLKIGLGDNNATRSVEYWNWKHNNSFFGKSYVLLAYDNNVLIGVRAFMRWNWILEGKQKSCVRAVDTVTHPDYQKQGLFKKLTLTLLDECFDKNIDFVFNTPNANSLPGYKKMGWKELGKMDLYVRSTNLYCLIKNRLVQSNLQQDKILKTHEYMNISQVELEYLVNQWSKESLHIFKKDITIDYLKWRYADCPAYKYGFSSIKNGKGLIIFRVLKKGRIRELRICDAFVLDNEEYKDFSSCIGKLLRIYNCDVATLTIGAMEGLKVIAKKSLFFNIGNKGLVFTLKSLNVNIDEYLDYRKWGWSSGDIEIF